MNYELGTCLPTGKIRKQGVRSFLALWLLGIILGGFFFIATPLQAANPEIGAGTVIRKLQGVVGATPETRPEADPVLLVGRVVRGALSLI